MEIFLKEIKTGSGTGIQWLECIRTANQEVIHSKMSISIDDLVNPHTKAYMEVIRTRFDQEAGTLVIDAQILPIYRNLARKCTRTTMLTFSIQV